MSTDRLHRLRALMGERGLSAYLIPSADQHSSEYVPEAWQRRGWISGFTGSAGDAVVTPREALLWTDSRYFLQAQEELEGSGFVLQKAGVPGEPTLAEWLAAHLGDGERCGADPSVISHDRASEIERELSRAGALLVMEQPNLVDALWQDRPALKRGPLEPWPERYAGESVTSKLARVREKLAELRADCHVLTRLDDIAWVYNIRGSDVLYTPLLLAYALICREEALLFVHLQGIEHGTPDSQVTLRAYDAFEGELERRVRLGQKLWVDGSSASRRIVQLCGAPERACLAQGPIPLFRAAKNPAEIEGMRRSHLRDGVAMVRFLRWITASVPGGGVTEQSAARRIEELRALGELYRGPSFAPIVAYGPHAALPHYRLKEGATTPLGPEGIVLVDCGGQYLDGTTDVTRTVALGPVTEEQRERFTLVLKGHIQLALLRFPRGTSGAQIDVLARKPLWDRGLNYGHGTGHGVGAYLCVHEGPHSISPSARNVPLEPGMVVVSDEPGYYEAGQYGIRTENLLAVAEDQEREGFLRFDNLTLCPIDTSLVVRKLLDPAEIDYLDAYHHSVAAALSPRLGGEDRTWLQEATRPLRSHS